MALFQSPQGQYVNVPDQYDPKTGENLAISQAKDAGLTQQVVSMREKDDSPWVAVPAEKAGQLSQKGWKSSDQVDSESAAKQSEDNVTSGQAALGKNGEEPSKTESALGGIAKGFTAGYAPQINGAVEAGQSLLRGGNESPVNAYRRGRDAFKSAQSAQQSSNPVSFGAGELGGAIGSIGAGGIGAKAAGIGLGGLVGAATGGAAYGAASGAADSSGDLTKGDIGQVAADTSKGAVYGAAGGAAGYGVGKLAGLGASALKGVISSPEGSAAYEAGKAGQSLLSPEARQGAVQEAVQLPSSIEKSLDGIKQSVGQQKGDLLKSAPELDHSPLLDSIEGSLKRMSNSDGTVNIADFTKDRSPQTIKAFQSLQDQLVGARQTLLDNPNDPEAIDAVKKAMYSASESPEIAASHDAKLQAAGISSNARLMLENHIDGLKSTNQGYKDITQGLNGSGADNIIPSASDIQTLGSRGSDFGATMQAGQKLSNLQNLHKQILMNDGLPQDLKDEFTSLVNSIGTKSRTGVVAQQMERAPDKGGLTGLTQFARPAISNAVGQGMGKLGQWANQITDAAGIQKIQQLAQQNPRLIELMNSDQSVATRILTSLGIKAGSSKAGGQ
jgi:hypothetical protein